MAMRGSHSTLVQLAAVHPLGLILRALLHVLCLGLLVYASGASGSACSRRLYSNNTGSGNNTDSNSSVCSNMTTLYQLPALPYDYEALEPFIDATTMNLHHKGHHQTYVNNLNAALAKAPELKSLSLPELLSAVGTPMVPGEVATAVRNNGGGHWNHSFFWKIMAPPASVNGPSPELSAAIDAAFGSMDEMKAQFNKTAASVFGSGWAWLAVKPGDGLVITSTANQDNPLMSAVAGERVLPVMGIDCWEHAYYLKYNNRRPEYIAAWWNVVNLPQASANFAEAVAGKTPSAL